MVSFAHNRHPLEGPDVTVTLGEGVTVTFTDLEMAQIRTGRVPLQQVEAFFEYLMSTKEEVEHCLER